MQDYPVLSSVSRCYPSPRGTFFTRYSPVRPASGDVNTTLNIDLHVLSILSAFILSQDQTLHSTLFFSPYLFFHLFFCFFLFSFHCPRQPVSPIDKNHSIKIHPLCQYLFRLFFNIFFELLSNTYFYWVLSL